MRTSDFARTRIREALTRLIPLGILLLPIVLAACAGGGGGGGGGGGAPGY